ncbi:MAG: hypothetical protein ABIS14_00780 [Sphingomonas sp.]
MGRAIWVMSGFAAGWSYLGIIKNGWPLWLVALPMAASALLIAIAQRRRFIMHSTSGRRRIGRLLLIWTVAEFAAIAVMTTLLIRWHFDEAIAAAAVIIVGAHFLPLARGIPVPLYYATGAGMIAFGVIAMLLAPSFSFNVAVFGAAATLWASVIVMLGKSEPRTAR